MPQERLPDGVHYRRIVRVLGRDERRFPRHVEDPVTFERSIRVTIEHGHANKRGDDYSSVAYWYQAEPHKPCSI